MKSKILILAGMMLMTLSTYAQNAAELFDPTVRVTWLGIDYSQAKYYGDPGTTSKGEMVSGFNAINHLIIAETEKFNISKFFKKNKLENDIQAVLESNEATDAESIITYASSELIRFTPDSIQKYVGYLHFPERLSGSGLVFFAETLNKSTAEESFWVAYIDIPTKKVLFTERVVGKPQGFGFRNFWAGGFYSVLKKVDDSEYRTWKKKYVAK